MSFETPIEYIPYGMIYNKINSNGINFEESNSNETWPSIQRRMILNALLEANGKKNIAAKILGMGRSTLWRKIKQYKIEP